MHTHQVNEGIQMLEQALQIDSNSFEVLINLGALYADEGRTVEVRELYSRAHSVKPSDGDGLLISTAILLSPIVASLEQMTTERQQLLQNVQQLANRGTPMQLPHLTSIPRVQFYLTYDGLNNRVTQEAIANLYRASEGILFTGVNISSMTDSGSSGSSSLIRRSDTSSSSGVNKASIESTAAANDTTFSNDNTANSARIDQLPTAIHTTANSTDDKHVHSSSTGKPIRVAFVSKFLGEHEPHGMLVAGVIRGLPRPQYHVILCPIPVPRQPPAASLIAASDSVQMLTLNYAINLQLLAAVGATM
jgi:predicted O-linked N-acetylglucosamine transferase (SPINDLY family)